MDAIEMTHAALEPSGLSLLDIHVHIKNLRDLANDIRGEIHNTPHQAADAVDVAADDLQAQL